MSKLTKDEIIKEILEISEGYAIECHGADSYEDAEELKDKSYEELGEILEQAQIAKEKCLDVKRMSSGELRHLRNLWNMKTFNEIPLSRRKLNIVPRAEVFMTVRGLEVCNATGYEVCINGEWWEEYADHNADRYYKKRDI